MAPLVALQLLSDQGPVGRSYFDIRTGPSQLFSKKSSQLLAKSGGTARCGSSFRHIYFGKSQLP